MKKSILLFLFLGSTLVSFGQISYGGGLAVGSASGYNFPDQVDRFNFGIEATGQYDINDFLKVDADFIFFYPQPSTDKVTITVGGVQMENDFKVTTTNYQANIGVQAKLMENHNNSAYFVAGPSYGGVSFSATGLSNSSSYLGGSAGFAFYYPNNMYIDIKLQYRSWDEADEGIAALGLDTYQGLVTFGYLLKQKKAVEAPMDEDN